MHLSIGQLKANNVVLKRFRFKSNLHTEVPMALAYTVIYLSKDDRLINDKYVKTWIVIFSFFIHRK